MISHLDGGLEHLSLHPPLQSAANRWMMFSIAKAKQWFLKLVIMHWRLFVTRLALEVSQTELARRMPKTRSLFQAPSIWEMNKLELVEEARRHLGMTQVQANSKTVVVLRELLKTARAQEETVLDPMCRIPPGLEKMPKAALIEEMKLRSLPAAFTRSAMIVAIRDQVESRVILSARAATANSMDVGTESGRTLDGDWTIAQEEAASSRRRK